LKAIRRQYHTYFSWDAKNANQFFGLFGKEFKEFMNSEIKKDDKLDDSIKAFLEIGRERNRLTHEDIATFNLEKDTKALYNLYQTALYFVETLPKKLKQFS